MVGRQYTKEQRVVGRKLFQNTQLRGGHQSILRGVSRAINSIEQSTIHWNVKNTENNTILVVRLQELFGKRIVALGREIQ